jgi:hypothetical protein
MLESAMGWTRARLRGLPVARRLYRAWKHYRLCNVAYGGDTARVRDRLEALRRDVGSDRLPFGTRVPLLAEWLDDLDRVAPGLPADPRRILFFNAMPHWVEFNLPVAVVLAARGCLVDFVWLPFERMDGVESDDSPARVPRGRLTKLFPFVTLHSRLRLCNLRHVRRSAPSEEMRRCALKYGTTDVQYWLRCERLDYEGDERVRNLLQFRTARNLDCAARLLTLLRRRPYDALLIPNGGVYEFGMAYDLGRHRGLPCITFDFSERKGHLFTSRSVPCVELDTTALWRADEPHVLTPEREERVLRFLLTREKPNWLEEGDYIWPGQSVSVAAEDRLRAELGLAANRPTALLCTNLAYDSAVLGHMRTFASMAEWMLETIAWFARRPDWQLVVRCHPAEAIHPSGEPAAEVIAARFPHLPAHVRVIEPADKVNTYGLMRFTRLGLVYTTTTGLEMAARGIPVIVAGKVHYLGKGFTTDPANPAEYFAALERATAGGGAALPRRQVELARCYADVYFERLPRPFPWWNIGNLERDLEAWPMRRLLAGDCPEAFLRTFDYLGGVA